MEKIKKVYTVWNDRTGCAYIGDCVTAMSWCFPLPPCGPSKAKDQTADKERAKAELKVGWIPVQHLGQSSGNR